MADVGKGDWRRPSAISKEQLDSNLEQLFPDGPKVAKCKKCDWNLSRIYLNGKVFDRCPRCLKEYRVKGP